MKLVLTAAALALGLAACGDDASTHTTAADETTTTATSGSDTQETPAQPATEGQPAGEGTPATTPN